MRKLPEHGLCFVCGSDNPASIGVVWYAHEDGTITGEVTLSDSQQGPPGMAHGGASAAILDEAMGASAWLAGHRVAAIGLNVEYRRPVPLGMALAITARVVGAEDRIVRTESEIRLPDGVIAVVAQGVFKRAEHLFEGVEFAGGE
jgi:uncharacterized protein (TIGR00369 family)